MSILKNLKIGCMGTGNMGNAILSGLSDKINKENIFCYDIDNIKLEAIKNHLGIKIASSPADMASDMRCNSTCCKT